MQQGWIIVYITTVVLVARGYTQNLSVSVTPKRSRFSEKQNVEVTLNYKNKGPNTVMIYDWYLPNQDLFHPLFEVTRDGKLVEYIGPLVKRRAPTTKDMIPLESGKDVSTVVQLSSVYNMTGTGNYVVQLKLDVGLMLLSSARDLETASASSARVAGAILQSAPVALFVEGRSNKLIETSAQVNLQTRSTTNAYISCSEAQKSAIVAAISSAITYSSTSMQYLATLSSASSVRYTTWFGKYSSSNLITLKTHFTNINTVFNTKSMTFDCGCNMNVYAYVYSNAPYKVYLCPLFWSAPATGTDSKSGTLIHETSHFTVVAGNNDYVYGQAGCKSLAVTNPTSAVSNADSHEYFAENNPFLK
jgi:peptidyl-Lys metalloendopeptidase